MKRAAIRALKRAVRNGPQILASAEPQKVQHAALALLSRSVSFGHGRLAVLRLQLAVEAGAQVPHDLWAYCARAAGASQDATLQGLYRDAAVLATRGPAETPV